MSDATNPSRPVSSTPEGGPIDAGPPASDPGAGQVYATPEAAPLGDDETLVPPTWREHMDGPILGMDDAPLAAAREARATAEAGMAADATAPEPGVGAGPMHAASEGVPSRTRAEEDELRKWPPYSGKPVSEVRWQEIGRYAAPVASQAEKLAISAIDLSARGLSKLAGYLENRRREREAMRDRERSGQH